LERIRELTTNPVLSNSARLGTLLSLYVANKLTFSDLLKITELPKSSLFAHLQVLEEAGLIRVRKQFTVSGPRTIAEITDKGRDTVKRYLDVLKQFQ
jgi:DNA-binding MarR family transcriptional regulator